MLQFTYVKQLLCIVSQSNDVYNCIRIMVLIPNMEMLRTIFQVILFMIHVENGGETAHGKVNDALSTH